MSKRINLQNSKIMKKLFYSFAMMLVAMLFVSTEANAYEFDGIDLNGKQQQVSREISTKGYVYDSQKGCLTGNCQGKQIYLSLNTTDVSEAGRVGQLIVEIPFADAKEIQAATTVFNVIYHQTANENGVVTYSVDKDGTTMALTQSATGIKLVYNTPYYKNK